MTELNDYGQTIEWLYNLHLFGIKFGLKKIEKLLEYLGNPQDQLKIIHVGGTNGKGSVCAIRGSILTSAGFKVGVNTSPHLSEFTERITINGKQISRDDVLRYGRLLEEIRERVNSETEFGYATYFEVVTAIALKYFADNDVDIVILEVGLGGTYDATNVVTPALSVITNISLDHTEHLGNTLASVAENKAGIIKSGVPVITSNEHPEVLEVITKACEQHSSQLYPLGKDLKFEIKSVNVNGTTMDYNGLEWKFNDINIPLLGSHQGVNAALALGALELASKRLNITLPKQAIRNGLLNAQWPGRLELVQSAPRVLLDGAHNPAGAKALYNALQMFDYDKLILVFGCSEEKDIKKLIEPIIDLPNEIILTQANIHRAANPEMIKQEIKKPSIEPKIITSVRSAVELALEHATDNDLICICGSLFVVGEAREYWFGRDENNDAKGHRIHY
jgi:dihydrofolate synthase/folylpolyglutamate synthase